MNSRFHATRPDPNSEQSGRSRFGSTGNANRSGEFAVVIDYQPDRYTATVRTERGRVIQGVMRIMNSPGNIAPLQAGTQVLVTYGYGVPMILGVVSLPATLNLDTDSFSFTGVTGFGGEGQNQAGGAPVGNFRAGNQPRDLVPGDWVQMGQDGQGFGVLEGGVTMMKSSPLAQIRTHLLEDLVQVISRNYQQFSDMGIFEIKNQEGQINMSFRGGSDQVTEAGPDEEKWTIRFDMGSEGDLLTFAITTPQGQDLFKLHIDGDGHVDVYAINGISVESNGRSGGDHRVTHTTDSVTEVRGERTVTVQGNNNIDISGGSTETVTGDRVQITANDHVITALRDLTLSSGRNGYFTFQGSGNDPALSISTDTGGVAFTIGSPAAAANSSGLSIKTYNGNMAFAAQTTGDFTVDVSLGAVKTKSRTVIVDTSIPDSVTLGGSQLISNVAKFQEMQSMIQALLTALDTHVHTIPGTAVAAGFAPVTGSTSVPAIPISPQVSPLIPLVKSLTVGVGA